MKCKISGYFTVEAALLLPLAALALGVVLSLIMFSYNRCLLEQDVGMISLRVASFTTSYEDCLTIAEQLEQGLYQGKYLACEPVEISCKVTPGTVKLSGETNVRNCLWELLFGVSGQALETGYRNPKQTPLFWIRSGKKWRES